MARVQALAVAFILLRALAADAQSGDAQQAGQPPGETPAAGAAPPANGAAPQTSTPLEPGVTITGEAPRGEPPLPKLPPNQFTMCVAQSSTGKSGMADYSLKDLVICEDELDMQKHVVIETCINRNGKSAPARVVQACTESLDRKILEGDQRFYLYVNRAEGYVALGDKQNALADYNEAIKLAPRNAKVYYNRGVFYAEQHQAEAALGDFDTAVGLDPKLAPAFGKRARIYQTRGNLSAAVADYSEAIRLQPKEAAWWSERGYVALLRSEYQSAIDDESQAIHLDPKLARAYYFRGAAFDGLGNPQSARADVATAVHLDPTLQRYVKSSGASN